MASASPQDTPEDETLSIVQMKCLLGNAKTRLDSGCRNKSADGLEIGICQSTPPASTILDIKKDASPYFSAESYDARMESRRLLDNGERKQSGMPRQVAGSSTAMSRQENAGTNGPDWFNMPRTKSTPSLKKDLQLLKMRSTWDPKRHYRKESHKSTIPEYSQIGTIIEGPTEFYSSRIANRDRKKSFVDEILGWEKSTAYFKNKYNHIQSLTTSGRRAFYRNLQRKRGQRNRHH